MKFEIFAASLAVFMVAFSVGVNKCDQELERQHMYNRNQEVAQQLCFPDAFVSFKQENEDIFATCASSVVSLKHDGGFTRSARTLSNE